MKTAVIYWSGSGNTEQMANAIKSGIEKANVAADIFSVSDFAAEKLKSYDAFAFGCPAMGAEVLEESEFEPFFADAEAFIKNKPVILFGSYGWGDGEWMRNWETRTKSCGARLFADGLIVNNTPDGAALLDCSSLGEKFAASL
jgi:flavodoxin short chain